MKRLNKTCLALAITHTLALPVTQAATITVTSGRDNNLGCTLRDAIDSINNGSLEIGCATSGGDFGTNDIILIKDSFSGFTLELSQGELPITKSMTINGPLPDGLTISGLNQTRVFNISSSTVSLNNLIVDRGQPDSSSSHHSGGGITIETSVVTLANSTVSNSTGSTSAGGINVRYSSLTLINSTISGNRAGGLNGGGIGAYSSGITLINSTVSNNQSWGGDGGGLSLVRTTTSLSNSTVTDNIANGGNGGGNGGGIFAFDSDVVVTNSTVSGNSAVTYGGGISAVEQSNVDVINSTVSGNIAKTGGGILAFATDDIAHPPLVTLSNSIIAGNYANSGDEVGGVIATFLTNNANLFGHEAISNGDAFSFLLSSFTLGDNDITATSNGTIPTSIAAILDPTLRDNGGPTRTHALVAGSPAIDAGDNTFCTNAPVNSLDQRGVSRPQGTSCDIGAYELEDNSFFVIPLPSGKAAIFSL